MECPEYDKLDSEEQEIGLQRLDIADLPQDQYFKVFNLNIIDRMTDVRGQKMYVIPVMPENSIEEVKHKLEEYSGKYNASKMALLVEDKSSPLGKIIMRDGTKLRDYGVVSCDCKMQVDVVPREKAIDWSNDPEGMMLVWGGNPNNFNNFNNFNNIYYHKYQLYKKRYLDLKRLIKK